MGIRKIFTLLFLVGGFLFLLFISLGRTTSPVKAQEECTPGVLLSKQIKGDDLRVFPTGSDVTFDITIQNTGNVELTSLHVQDPLVPDCARAFTSLAVGGTISYTCTSYGVTQGFMNYAKVIADSECGPVNDDDVSTIELAGLAISKQEPGNDSRIFASGSDVTYTIYITNTDEVELTNIVVSDPLVPDCERVIESLPAFSSTSFTCTAPGVTAGFTNIVTATTTIDEVTILQAQDPSTVLIPGIDISKQAEGDDTRSFPPGSDVTFTIFVTNTGDVDLTNVTVTDVLVPDCEQVIGDLPAGESTSYECTATNVTEGFTNIAKVTGFGGQVPVLDEDPSTVEVSEKLYWLYLPFGANPGFIKYNVSFGYEDLRIEEANDFDYNDWVVSVETDFNYTTIDQDTINLNRVAFTLTPQARGALLAHEYHISFPPNTFGSNGTATLNLLDSGGNIIDSTLSTFNASQANDFHVFDRTSDALPPSGSLVNTTEGIGPNLAAQTAELIIQFDSTFQFTLEDFGPHGEGLFFEPYLQVIPLTGARYNVGNGDVRTIVFPISNWRWPEERVRIDRAYPGITFVGPPQIFTFPDGWWQVYNSCIYGDAIVCPNP
jgi:uncharacterized repeat protein (TIGR01451 family)